MKEPELKVCPLCKKLVNAHKLERHIRDKCELRPCPYPHPHPYNTVLPLEPMPLWLERLSRERNLPKTIPLKDLLCNSCFYPSSGLDSSPVILANGCVHSFVFVDYSTTREKLLNALSPQGFSPYKALLSRDVAMHEVAPDGWFPSNPQRFNNPGFGDYERLDYARKRCKPFGHWSVWQRKDTHSDLAGPRLFSFLFLGGEGLACYEGMYRRNDITPKAIALIQPGHAMGDNWTAFTDPEAPLWSTVREGGSFPNYLLIGRWGESRYPPRSECERECERKCEFKGYEYLDSFSVGRDRYNLEREEEDLRLIRIFKRSPET